jgi:hypothetical protein
MLLNSSKNKIYFLDISIKRGTIRDVGGEGIKKGNRGVNMVMYIICMHGNVIMRSLCTINIYCLKQKYFLEFYKINFIINEIICSSRTTVIISTVRKSILKPLLMSSYVFGPEVVVLLLC